MRTGWKTLSRCRDLAARGLLFRLHPVLMAVVAVLAVPAPADRAAAGEPAWQPAGPVRIIVPFAVGGGLDVSCRLLARYAEPELGERILVVNNTAGGNIRGNDEGVRAAPDGQVIGAWGLGLVTDELVVRNAPYTHRDIVPLCMYSREPHIIAVGRHFARSAGVASLADLVRFTRDNPNRVTFGIGGNWTSHDFVRLALEETAGIGFVRMPFLGGLLAGRAAAAGNCDVVSLFPSEFLALPADAVLPLALTHDSRLPLFPDLPTAAEQGLPEVTRQMWRALTLPRNTPPAIAARLEEVFGRVLEKPDYRREAAALGFNPVFMGRKAFAEFLEAEYEYYAAQTERWGIRVPPRDEADR